jgi:hypothetical protein
MDFTKYVSMLEDSALWFSRTDCLGDPFDSEFPNTFIAKRKQNWQQAREEALTVNHADVREAMLKQIDGAPEFWKNMRRRYAVNCWHQNENESAAMWKLYLKSEEGIAIVSTPRKLIDSIRSAPYLMLVGSVEYVDFNDYPPFNNMFVPVMRKRKSFGHEHELRIVAVKERDGAITSEPFEECGVPIKVDVSQLLEAIYVSPTAEDWFARLVEQMAHRFNITCPVRRSSLSEIALW